MSYAENQTPFMSPQPSYQSGSDAIAVGVWPQFSDDQFEPHSQFPDFEPRQPPFKRPRNSEDNVQFVNSRMPQPTSNLPFNNRGTANIFFKTRICAKFKNTGSCRNGDNCTFAHGMHDLRQPPHNWQELVAGRGSGEEDLKNGYIGEDDQKIIHKNKLCKKYYNGEPCPYGDNCSFRHESASKFREDAPKFRESSAISIGPTAQPMMYGSGASNVIEVSKPMNGVCSDAIRGGTLKPVFWKTKLCSKWEITGQCPFGEKCHFAHGSADLQAPGGGRVESEVVGNLCSNKPLPILSANVSPSMTAIVPSLVEEGQDKKCLIKWKGFKKINRIYGDWLDDLPLVQNLTNQVES